MTELYNRNSEKEKRQFLRNNMTVAEQKLWFQLKGKQLENCKFQRQYGVAQFVIDFYSPEIKLAIEVDGDSHFQQGVQEYDRERQLFIESANITFLRFTNDDIHNNISEVCEVIRGKIQSLRPPLALPLLRGEEETSQSPPLLRAGLRHSNKKINRSIL